MVRIAPLLALLLAASGCTMERIHRDSQAGLDFLGLGNATRIAATSRWQIAADAVVAVHEVAPAVDDRWLAAAQEGVSSVLGARPSASPELELIVAWPGDRLAAAHGNGYIRYLRIDKLIRGADPMSVQVYLCDARTGTLIQAATLDLDPHWLSDEGSQRGHIRAAFREYAQGLVSRY